MATVAAAGEHPWDGTAIPFRVHTLEHNETETATRLAAMDVRVDAHDVTLGVHAEQNRSLTAAVAQLKGSVDKVMWSLIGLCLTIAGSAASVSVFVGK